MKINVKRIAWLWLLACGLTINATPARAQFEEEDTIPRFAIGATGEIVFRGSRGQTEGSTDVSLGGGPALGLRMEYRVSKTLDVALAGSYARPSERLKGSNFEVSSNDPFDMIQVTGELLLRVKPNIPGYFILGGGVRYTDAVGSDPIDYFHNIDPFTDPLGILGAGIAFGQRRSRMFKFNIRFYFVSPSEQLRFDTKSVEIDFGLDLEFLFRL